jgi:tetratricopeptide (TPR) repeat protein
VSVIAFIIATLSFVFYWIIPSLQVVLGQSLTNALQTFDSLLGIGAVILGAAAYGSDYFSELPTPPEIRDYAHIFPKIDNDTPEILRELNPHRVDFEEDFIVLPNNIGGLILKKIGVRAGNLFGIEISKKDADMKVRIGLVAGPSGCGKSTTVVRFCFELLKFKWRIYYSDVYELFTVSNISEIRDWICSLRKKNLIVLDNIQTNRNQLNILLDTVEDLHEEGLLRMRTKIRILCIETRAHPIESVKRDSNVEHIDGKRISTIPFSPSETVGLGVTKTKTFRPSGDLIGKIPTLIIERGEDIAKLILHRFIEVVRIKSTLDFNTIFSKTGSVVEFCEVLRWIKENSDHVDAALISDSFSKAADIALERRLKAIDDREVGVLTLGLISAFSQVGSVVSTAFLESVVGKTLSTIINQLLNAQHLLEMFVGPAQKQFLIYTHAELARLLRIACALVLQDLFSIDSDSEVDIKLYEMYLDYINSLPPKSSIGIGSSFILALSSHAAIHRLKHIADFVITKGTSWINPDINIKYSLYNMGQFYFKIGKFEKAERILRNVISIDGQFIEARANLGALLLFQGKLEQAREQYEIAIVQKPDDASLHANLSQVFWEEGDTSMALEKMQTSIDLASNVGRYRYQLGKMLAALEKESEGLPHLREAISLEPDDVEFYVGLSHSLINLNEIDEAEKVILAAVSRNLKSPLLCNNHGVILKKRGNIEAAKAKFEEALTLNPNFGLSLANLGERFLLKNNLAMAEKKVCEALKFEPDQGKVHALYGQILHTQKRYAESIEAFEKSIALGFEPPEMYANLAIAYYELGKFDESDESMDRALEISKDPKSLCGHICHYYLSKLDFLRAKRNLVIDAESMTSGEIDSNQLKVLSKLADSALRNEDFTVAEWALENLSVVNPDLAIIWCNLGAARAKLEKFAEAKTALLKATKIDPNNPAIWYNLGNVLKQLGEVEESTKAYDKAKQISNQSSEI